MHVFWIRLTFHVPLCTSVHSLHDGVLIIRQFHRRGEKLDLFRGQFRLFLVRMLEVVDENGLVAQERDEPHDLIESHLEILRLHQLIAQVLQAAVASSDFLRCLGGEEHDDLEHGRRRLVEFKEGDLHEGCYYVLRGVVLYLEQNLAVKQKIEYKSGAKVRREGRTRCIFDNGTESSMLYRSLGKALKLDGFCISDLIEKNESSVSIDSTDVQNGYIYVLRSLSRAPQIRSIRNLYKIGYCSGDVTTRIKNAVHEPTYLMNDVEVR